MSKQSEAKEKQGYQLKPLVLNCKNCTYRVPIKDSYKTYDGVVEYEKSQMCGKGNFKINLTARCNEHKLDSDDGFGSAGK